MPHNDGFPMEAFKAHLNVIYHNKLTDIEPASLNLFADSRQAMPAKYTKADTLGKPAGAPDKVHESLKSGSLTFDNVYEKMPPASSLAKR
jgi:hypothetical protein